MTEAHDFFVLALDLKPASIIFGLLWSNAHSSKPEVKRPSSRPTRLLGRRDVLQNIPAPLNYCGAMYTLRSLRCHAAKFKADKEKTGKRQQNVINPPLPDGHIIFKSLASFTTWKLRIFSLIFILQNWPAFKKLRCMGQGIKCLGSSYSKEWKENVS